ncbi:hypothetical protein H9Q10_08865 [Eikenella sp. S3360]|uniref:Surface-adhesin protein E-like domain-containing protein n=1 Tax=Eikenella glucosivorans TaxID=2766967 RepID=A0ABS0NBW5_9NEIS|nr:surface-adhesin E family protein [Eikenella glucosivorans]MBH5329778.1 hypothetical protein [Eikenella glucosivorans]
MRVSRFAPLCAALVLAGCPSVGGPGGSWKEVGVSPNGNMRYEIDNASIRKTGNQASFRERITVSNPKTEHYVNTPHFKTAVNQWLFDCQARTRRLVSVEMWDASGNKLASHQYGANGRQPVPVVRGSAGGSQFETACGRSL